jgi:YVTN family beta-propeller protein
MRTVQRTAALLLTLAGLTPVASIAPAASASPVLSADAASNSIRVTATIPVGDGPFGAAVNPQTGKIYVANRFSNTVSVIDGHANQVTATIPAGTGHTGSR